MNNSVVKKDFFPLRKSQRWKTDAPLTELLNGRLKLLVLIDILHVNMLLLSSLGA